MQTLSDVLLGVIEPGGKWEIASNADVTALTAAEQKFFNSFEDIAHTGSLVCAMGAISHFTINHTTGQGKLQGFTLKVAKVLKLGYPTEHMSAAEERRKNITVMLYAAAHPVAKRNMLYVLDRAMPCLSAVWAPGIPRPAHVGADEFLKVQVGGVPAGARKIYVALEACKHIAANGLLCAMPGIAAIAQMNAVMARVKGAGVAAYVGASYYLHNTDIRSLRVDQNRDEFHDVIICAGAYLEIVAPGCTLAASPAFANVRDEANAEFGEWVAECQAYMQAREERVESGLAGTVSKYATGVEGIATPEAI